KPSDIDARYSRTKQRIPGLNYRNRRGAARCLEEDPVPARHLIRKKCDVSRVVDRYVIDEGEEWAGWVCSRCDSCSAVAENLRATVAEECRSGDSASIVDNGIQKSEKVRVVGVRHNPGAVWTGKDALSPIREETPEHNGLRRIDRGVSESDEVRGFCIDQ